MMSGSGSISQSHPESIIAIAAAATILVEPVMPVMYVTLPYVEAVDFADGAALHYAAIRAAPTDLTGHSPGRDTY
jgi:hypothetical protein